MLYFFAAIGAYFLFLFVKYVIEENAIEKYESTKQQIKEQTIGVSKASRDVRSSVHNEPRLSDHMKDRMIGSQMIDRDKIPSHAKPEHEMIADAVDTIAEVFETTVSEVFLIMNSSGNSEEKQVVRTSIEACVMRDYENIIETGKHIGDNTRMRFLRSLME